MKVVDTDESEYITGDGRHEPLWDMDTYERIQDEIKKRGIHYTGRRAGRVTMEG